MMDWTDWNLWLEAFGLISGLLCVWLLIRQNILTFPIGLAYAVATVVVMAQSKLYADVLLNAYYVLINAYGWWYWTRARKATGTPLAVTWTPRGTQVWLLVACVLGIALMTTVLSQTDAELIFWDSTTTILSFAAMWMTARKYVENWAVWWVVDIIATVMYVYKGLYFYAVLYGIYLVMAVMGWRAWRATMTMTREAV